MTASSSRRRDRPFAPATTICGRGLRSSRREGDCSKFLAHLKDNVARGDETTYLWIVGWWAQILQQPSVKMETALVLRGPFGAGKTKIGEVIGSLIGDALPARSPSPRYITGQFNSHMASLLVLHADEAFWAGDKASVGTLRDLVTGKDHMLEYKGVDPIRIKNHIRLFVTGNPDWMVPAGFRERRWAVFDIGEEHMQDHAYFAAIDHEMNNGGREALLHYLLNFDLSQVNLRIIPKTAALLDQQIESMTPEQAWWFETLMKGELPPQPHGINEPNVCLREDLFEHYVRHAQIQGVSHRSIETRHRHVPAQAARREAEGHTARLSATSQVRCYKLPPLKDCRRLFSERLGQPVDWGSEEWESEDVATGARRACASVVGPLTISRRPPCEGAGKANLIQPIKTGWMSKTLIFIISIQPSNLTNLFKDIPRKQHMFFLGPPSLCCKNNTCFFPPTNFCKKRLERLDRLAWLNVFNGFIKPTFFLDDVRLAIWASVRPGKPIREAAAGYVDRFHVFFVSFRRAPSCPVNCRGGGSKVCGIRRCPLRRDTPIVVGENPKPAAVLSWPFEGNKLHLLPGVSDLSLGESVLCASLYDQGCRRGSVRQNVLQKDFWVFSPARGCLIAPSVGGGRPALSRLNMSLATAVILWFVHRNCRDHIRGVDVVGVGIVGIDRDRFAVVFDMISYPNLWLFQIEPRLPRLRLRCWQAHRVF